LALGLGVYVERCASGAPAGSRVQGSGFRVSGFGFRGALELTLSFMSSWRQWSAGFRISGWVSGGRRFGVRASGCGFRVSGGIWALEVTLSFMSSWRQWSARRTTSSCCITCSSVERSEMCSGSEVGSYLRLIDFVHHSTVGLRVIAAASPPPAPSAARRSPWVGGGGARICLRILVHLVIYDSG